MAISKEQIAQRIAKELKNNTYVNLGIGIPTLVANFVPKGINVEFQSENGVLGMGPLSFAMIRGKHIGLTVLGAMEVSQSGDIANWKIPGKMVKGMGGAMDLVASADNIIVAMMHTNKKGKSKLLKKCSLPITGVKCVKKIVTNLAVIDVTPQGFLLLERAPGVSVEEIKSATQGKLIVKGQTPEMNI